MNYTLRFSSGYIENKISNQKLCYDLRGLPLLPDFTGGDLELFLLAEVPPRPRPPPFPFAAAPFPLALDVLEALPRPLPRGLFTSASPLISSSSLSSLSSASSSSSSDSDESFDFFLFFELSAALAPFFAVCLETGAVFTASLPADRAQ